MLKRRSNAGDLLISPSGSLSPPASPSPRKLKRPKNTIDDDPQVSGSGSSSNAEFSVNEIGEEDDSLDIPITSRDQDYYFEDGSIILRVGDILFKVQGSLLKAHSEVFKDMFAMPLGTGNDKPIEGSCDEHPVVIPGVEPSQFRNLMKMFYCPPSDKLFIGLHVCEKNKTKVWENFQFYLDVARLSHRFGISNMEQWANSQLKCLFRTAAEDIWLEAGDGAAPCFLDALWYSVIISDDRMTRDIRNMIQCYADDVDDHQTNIALFKSPDLREKDPSLFGFLFALLLSWDPDTWKQDPLTRVDRMALFSARVYLTPLPIALLAGLQTPLFTRPASPNDFLTNLWNDPTKKSCNDKCRRTVFLNWLSEFSNGYYTGITSNQTQVALHALISIPYRRLQFANKIRSHQCAQNCYPRALKWLDRDIEQLYGKIANYYQEIK